MRLTFLLPFIYLLPLSVFAQNVNTNEVASSYLRKNVSFPGGQSELEQFLNLNLRYPNKAIENKISGEVIVSFLLDEKGDISAAMILKSLGYGCDEEALRVVGLMPRWEPAVLDGEPIKVKYILPIVFELPAELENKENN